MTKQHFMIDYGDYSVAIRMLIIQSEVLEPSTTRVQYEISSKKKPPRLYAFMHYYSILRLLFITVDYHSILIFNCNSLNKPMAIDADAFLNIK